MTRWFSTPLQLHLRWKNKSGFQTKRKIAGRYKLLREIGQGASGIVHLAVEIKTNKRYAIKEFNKSRLQRQYQSELFFQSGPSRRNTRSESCNSQSKKRKLNSGHQQKAAVKAFTRLGEAEILKYLSEHTNIIKFIEVIEDPEHQDSIFLVTEIAENGAVMEIKAHSVTKPYPDALCRKIFQQLVEAVDHLHQHKIIHRDIKPQNLVLSYDNTVKLIDFGNAICITDAASLYGINSSNVGSPAFIAPEQLKKVSNDQPHSSTCSDLWSMGVTLYCLAYGCLPFQRASLVDLYTDIQNKTVTHTEEIDPALIDLIDKLLEKNPKNRTTLKDVKMHPWMQNK